MNSASPTPSAGSLDDPELDFRAIFRRIRSGLAPTVGLALIFAVIALGAAYVKHEAVPTESVMKVHFSFPGIEKGLDPVGGAFLPDDLISPAVVRSALKSQAVLSGKSDEDGVQAALTVIPDTSGGTGVFPSSYQVSMRTKASAGISARDRELFLAALFESYSDHFLKGYARAPDSLVSVFDTLKDADYPAYAISIRSSLDSIQLFLEGKAAEAPLFRSAVTGRSFQDLRAEGEIFSQVDASEALGLIDGSGVSKNAKLAVTQLTYQVGQADADARKAAGESQLVRQLIDEASTLGSEPLVEPKSAAAADKAKTVIIERPAAPGAGKADVTSYLIRKALKAGAKANLYASRHSQLEAALKRLQAAVAAGTAEDPAQRKAVDDALARLKVKYDDYLSRVRSTYEDYSKQTLLGSVRMVSAPSTASSLRSLELAGFAGAFLGFALGLGLSLVGLFGPKEVA